MDARLNRLAGWLVAGFTALTVLFVLAVPSPAQAVDFFGNACDGAGKNSAACSGSGADTISGTDGLVMRAAELVSIIAGIAAIIVIIIAGIMFVTAAGDSNKISTAKKTLTYAVVGLVVIVLARTIVIFVVSSV